MIIKIKKGEKFICIKSFFMDDKEKAYTSGKIYISEINGCITDNFLDTKHEMDGYEEKEFLIYFKPHPNNIIIKGDRFNTGKKKWSLVSWKALEPMIEVLEFGATKYSSFNWCKGLKYTEICESLQRHLNSFIQGEDNDPESKLTHVGHIMCNSMFLSYMFLFKKDMDDRYIDKNLIK